ncbi:hypothetical protein O3M35_004361 [Rhynocoris fuscipes]|uniref:Uncharacterized protein n=1 Tax=Rhynocoris fuscipes TaxID=488301 RepID=A0AAW1CH98_9HEMI
MLFAWFTLMQIITTTVWAHVSLTFPPARKYDLDFLDNVRTKAPCGMPKGTLKTTILAGKQFNITWHLGYPHQGGIRLQVLDSLSRPVLDLTPVTAKSEFVSAADPTLQHYPVLIPADFECENCTIRLVREAKEWGENYRLWSCADVDIRTKKHYKEDCSGHGPYLLSKCRCNRLYRGPRCQYRDECVDHIDCGDMGRCVDIKSVSAPSKQCFCENGWFGPACTKKSALKSTTLDLSGHMERRLSDNLMLYWQVVEEEKEIEIVLVGNVSSYIAIGWRPLNITRQCLNFPFIHHPQTYNSSNYQQEPVNNVKADAVKSKNDLDGKELVVEENGNSEEKDDLGKKIELEMKRDRSSVASRVTRDDAAEQAELSVSTRVSFQVSTSKGGKQRYRREEEKSKDASSGAYTAENDFSPMDCTDMVIGMARGTSFRIWDYYSRDRSTPRLDTVWGGKNDLTSAMGFEKDGVTTIAFRKKLKSNEPTDHSIEKGVMHVIWAVGQETGGSKSGSATETAAIKEFYKADELKYHGNGSQRGIINIDFYQTSEKTEEKESSEEKIKAEKASVCKGSWSYPRDCNATSNECLYQAHWHLKTKTSKIHFTIQTKNTNTWTGIAFSRDHKMSQTDAIIGWVDKSGRPFMMDTWIVGQTAPKLDESQDITNITGRTEDGVTTLTFERNPDTSDTQQDLQFNENSCLYLMFPVMGGDFNPVNKRIRKHKTVPSFTSSKICLNFCTDGDEEVTARPEPTNAYLMKIRLKNLGTGFKTPNVGTDEFSILGNTVTAGFKNTVSKLSAFRSLKVEDFMEEGDGVVAHLILEVIANDKTKVDKEDVRNSNIYQLFEEAVSFGRVGTLTLDPTYFVFEPLNADKNMSSEGDFYDGGQSSETKLWIVLGCIIALLIMASMQALCTICKTLQTKVPVHKEKIAQNSAWKDYSTANTNYAFEPYEVEEKMRIGLMAGTNGSSLPSHQDTRSLSRPRNYHGMNTANLARPAYSLPRTQPPAYSRSHMVDQHGSNDRHLQQPDFYFMPSQRKYSGEVVRVYVDYNNSNK